MCFIYVIFYVIIIFSFSRKLNSERDGRRLSMRTLAFTKNVIRSSLCFYCILYISFISIERYFCVEGIFSLNIETVFTSIVIPI